MPVAVCEPGPALRRIPSGDDFLPKAEVAALTPGVLTRRMVALAPLVAHFAAEAEAQRRPCDEVWTAIRASGYFYQFVPSRYGGLETNIDSFIDATLPIAQASASTGWVASFAAEHNWLLAHFPDETKAAIWGGRWPYIVAPAVTAPPGRAELVEGGVRLSGHWKWGTGVMHADWIIASGLILAEDASPRAILALFPAEEASVLDTWQVDGMAGTGSNDIKVENLFVPTAYTVDTALMRSGRAPGSRTENNPIYSAPMLPFLAMTAAIAPLGAAKAVVEAYRTRLGGHTRMGSDAKQADKPAAHVRLAKADMMVNAAEILIRDAGQRNVDAGALEEPEQTPVRIALRAQLAHAVGLCRRAAMMLSEAAGSSAHMLDQPLQRAVRDIGVAQSHVVFDPDLAMELHGRAMLGLAPNSIMT